MLKVGVIGYGRRARDVCGTMAQFGIPFRISALADPRQEEIRGFDDAWLTGCAYYASAEELVEQGEMDGLMIATRCYQHTDMACLAHRRGLPLFLEKPVSISFEQLGRLERTFRGYTAPTVVSFPLRLTPMVQQVRELIEQDVIGPVEHAVAWNDVPYGRGYYQGWYRNYEQVGGLFLQKATHDLDYLGYLLGQSPAWVCAMKARRVYGGSMPHELRCRDCDRQRECPESPFNRFYQTYDFAQVAVEETNWCAFSREIRNEDCGNALLEYDNGVQVSYTQNFFARHRAARRGARLYGFKGTIEFDWYENRMRVFGHRTPTVTTTEFAGNMPHFGGDRELAYDFLLAMKEARPSRSPLSAGIASALTCLCARESSETRQFRRVQMPAEA